MPLFPGSVWQAEPGVEAASLIHHRRPQGRGGCVQETATPEFSLVSNSSLSTFQSQHNPALSAYNLALSACNLQATHSAAVCGRAHYSKENHRLPVPAVVRCCKEWWAVPGHAPQQQTARQQDGIPRTKTCNGTTLICHRHAMLFCLCDSVSCLLVVCSCRWRRLWRSHHPCRS
jgi:hypothetical protein